MRSCPRCHTSYADDSRFCPVDGTQTIDEGAAPEPGADPLLGRTLGGRYRLLKKLGEGGMGAVYEAEHTLLGKHVAIKVLLDVFSQQRDVLLRFQQEARAASTIGHENIIDIQDIGEEEDGRWYIVMEILRGQDLARTLREGGAMPLERAVPILRQICRALQAAHDKGIIHRDMKPENVYLTTRGETADFVKIMDFGISKVKQAHENVRLTQTGAVIGTPLYMAPEQARGDPEIDHRTDVYAVGVMAYEMLCGRPPFNGATYVALLTQHLTEPPPPPRLFRPDLPPAVEALLLRALEKDRNRRFGSMAELAAALPLAVTGPQTGLVPAGMVPAAAAWSGSGPQPLPSPPAAGAPITPAAPLPYAGAATPAEALPPAAPERRSSPLRWVLVGGLGGAALLGVTLLVLVVRRGPDATARREVRETVQTHTVRPPPKPPAAPRARVTVDSVPAGARVLIDSILVGSTPARADVAPGPHTLVLESPGYRRVAQPLEVPDTRPLPLTIRLERDEPPRVNKAPRHQGPRGHKPKPPRPPPPKDTDDGHKSSPYG